MRFHKISNNLGALNSNGAIKGIEAREDGVYITYVPSNGADAVTKKLGNELPGSSGAPDTLTISMDIGCTTGWVERAKSENGTWQKDEKTEKYYVYKNLALYKLESVSATYYCGAAVQGGGNASCKGTIYLDKYYSETKDKAPIFEKALNSAEKTNGDYEYVLTDEDFSNYDCLNLRSSVSYSASAGWGTYDQVSTSYTFRINMIYKKC